MGIAKLRWKVAALVAFLMGIPMVEQARASGAADITWGALSLAGAIIDAAGNS